MMKRLFALGVLGVGLVASPMVAMAATTDDDLLCVAWTAERSGKATDEGQKKALVNLMFYFVGRWEGATGRTIESGMTVGWVTANYDRITAAGPDCLQRGGDMANHLVSAGEQLQKAGGGK